MAKIAVLGNGSWGSVLGSMLADNGNDVVLYGNIDSVNQEINEHHTNAHYMKNWKLNPNVPATGNLENALDGAEIVLFVLPTKAVRIVAKKVRKILDKTGATPLLVTATKGIEPGSKKLISDILTEEVYPNNSERIVAISGPSHAENVAQKDLTAIACASTSEENAKRVQELFSNNYVRFYTNDDLVGVEIGGAVKNIIALAAGVCDGLGYGDNTKAALMTRGMAEIVRIGTKLGGKIETFLGLTGMGDLIVTCTSMHSRNRKAGYLIGTGKTREEAVKEVGMVVEGIKACHAFYNLKEKLNVEMPITDALYKVLFEDKDAKSMVKELLERDKKAENY